MIKILRGPAAPAPLIGDESEETQQAQLVHHTKVMNTALDLMRKFRNPGKWLKDRPLAYGQDTVKRCGEKRLVQFIQIGEIDSDLEMRIEVFIVKKGDTL